MTVAAPWKLILRQIVGRLAERGFAARTTFDLQLARHSMTDAEGVPCPHHGPGRCTCQYLVLQVGRHGQSPSSVVVHGRDDSTRVALLSAVGGRADVGIAAELCEALEHVREQAEAHPRALHGAAAGGLMRRRTEKT
jgi:hypothetical protein